MKLLLLLLLSCLLFQSVTATTATAVTAAVGSEVASEEEVIRVLRKYAKKTAHHVQDSNDRPPVCSIDIFPRVSKYQNCQGVESQVALRCAAAAPPRRTCQYTEHYINSSGAECRVDGSFDPIAQIGTDPARPDVCQLDFVSLKDSCIVDALPGFGMKAEVRMKTSPEEEETCTSSLMLLRFSSDGGSIYYNDEIPRTAMAVECAFLTPHTTTLADTVVRSTALVKTTAVVEKDQGIDARASSRPTQVVIKT